MTGPCTLLAQPHLGRYIDATGIHDMPWNDATLLKRDQYEMEVVPDVVSRIAYSNVQGLDAGAASADYRNLVPQPTRAASSGSFAAQHPLWTATNGTGDTNAAGPIQWGASAGTTEPYPIVAAFNRAFLKEVGIIASGANAELSIDVDTAGTAAHIAWAFIFNHSPGPRTYQLRFNGVDIGNPITIDPERTGLAYARFTSTTGAKPFVIRCTDSVNLDRFGVPSCAVVKSFNFSIGEVPGFVPPNEFWFPVDGSPPIDATTLDQGAADFASVWSGTAFASPGRKGDHYWYVPLEEAHLDPAGGAIVSRCRGWDGYGYGGYGVQITKPSAAYTYDDEWGYIAILVSTRNSTGSFETFLGPFVGADDFSPFHGQTQPTAVSVPISEGWDTLSYQWDADTIATYRSARGDVQGEAPLFSRQADQWPWINGHEESPVLMPGQVLEFYAPTAQVDRDAAIFNRELNDVELAFLEDQSSVWSYNMFAVPRTATVTGLAAPLYRSDDLRLTITVADEDGDAAPLYGCTVWFTAKVRAGMSGSGDGSKLNTCSVLIGNDGEATSSTNYAGGTIADGIVEFDFTVPFVRNGEAASTTMFWDVQVKDINGKVRTVAAGQSEIASDVTRRETTP